MHNKIISFLISAIGLAVLALTIDVFSWQNRLVTGGLPGYGLILNYLTQIPVGLSLFVANTIIILLVFLILGKSAGIKSVFGYIFLSAMIEFWWRILPLQPGDVDLGMQFINVIMQGAISAIAVAFVISNNYSFGNYSTMHILVNNYVKISTPKFFLVCDIVLSLLTLILFGWQKGVSVLINATVFYFVFKLALGKLAKIVK